MPIAVSHGEGYAELRDSAHLAALQQSNLVALRFVDNYGQVTENYPANPNGSPQGITAVTNLSGRVTAWGEDSPWMRMFRNARKQLG